VNFWIENGLMNLTGEKMSKSTKHFFSVEDVCAEVNPETLKFYLISTHYSSPVEFSRERLVEAEAALGRLRNVIRNATMIGKETDSTLCPAEAELSRTAIETEKRFVEAMDDDFNSARAVGHLFDLAKAINREIEAGILSPAQKAAICGASERMKGLGQILGLFWKEQPVAEEFSQEVKEFIREREIARKRKEWGRADEIRAKVEAIGFVVEDRPEGPVLRKKNT
jgi:cysteinyl-tRNA synthetase